MKKIKPTTGYAIVFPNGRLWRETHSSAKAAREYAHMFRPVSDLDHSWKYCYKLGYRVIRVTITPPGMRTR